MCRYNEIAQQELIYNLSWGLNIYSFCLQEDIDEQKNKQTKTTNRLELQGSLSDHNIRKLWPSTEWAAFNRVTYAHWSMATHQPTTLLGRLNLKVTKTLNAQSVICER